MPRCTRMSPLAVEPVATSQSMTPRRPRLFATRVEEPRARRATDVIGLVGSVFGLALLSLFVFPASGFERAIVAFVDHVPGGLDGAWQLAIDVLAVWAAVLVVASLARRRFGVARDLVLAGILAALAGAALGRVVMGDWPPLWDSLRTVGSSTYPSLRLAVSVAVVLTAAPHLSQPARRLGWWFVVAGGLAVVVSTAATPTSALAGVLVAGAVSAAVHVALGSCRGRPSLEDVELALRGLGVPIRSLGAADRQRAGFFLVDAIDDEGEPLVVKVYGRDAADTQLLTTLWRRVWFREAGWPVSLGRLHQVEHEAFLTLLANQAGVLAQGIVTAGATTEDDVVLVLRPVGRSLAPHGAPWDEAVGRALWTALGELHDAGISHGQVDDAHLIVDGDRVGFVDFRGGAIAPAPERIRTDRAQALVTSAIALGPDTALDLAIEALGAEDLAALLPLVQMTALTDRQQDQVRAARLDLGGLLAQAARRTGSEVPQLQKLRRVTWGSVVQIVLLVVAFLALASFFGGLDLEHLGDQLSNATWAFVIVGLLLAQAPRLSQAVSTLGASPTPVPLGPLYVLQLASSYIALAVPSSAARIAVNIRFFQRHGLATGSALAVGALDGITGFVVQALLLAGILVLTPLSLDVDLSGAAPTGLIQLVVVVVGLGVLAALVLVIVPRWRRWIFGWLRQLGAEAWGAARGLRSPRRLGMLIGGNLGNELLFALALGAFARSLGYPIGLHELLLINISVSLLAGLLPIPGGIGVVEGGLTLGLVRAGMPEETAFVAVLFYRLSTFYLPPIWGFFALRWLERHKHL